MPLLAQMNPCRVSVIRTPRLRRTTHLLSRKASSVTRGSTPNCFPHAREAGEARTVPRSTMAPSALDTILCLITIMSPGARVSFATRSAPRSLSTMESPGEISSSKGTGIRWTSDVECRLFICRERVFSEIPLTCQFLRPALSLCGGEFLQVGWIVDIECDPGQGEHGTRQARRTRSPKVRLEAVVSESQRKQRGWTAVRGVSSTAIGSGNQHGAPLRSSLQDGCNFGNFDQRDVTGNDQ